MTRRRTRCFTWGQTRMTREPLVDTDGRRVGGITYVQYHTACGKWATDADDPPDDITGSRPPGVCPRCWSAR